MKILLVLTSLEMGGAERVVIDLADHLVYVGHEVKIVYLVDIRKIMPRREEVELICLGMNKNPLSFMLALFRLRRVVCMWGPDVVHCHQFHAIFLSRMLRLFAPVPKLVSSAHNTVDGGRFRRIIYKLSDRLSDVNTNVSCEAVDNFLKFGCFSRQKTLVMHNSIDVERFAFSPSEREKLRRFYNIDNDTVLFLAVGRLHTQKDYPSLLQAFNKVLKANKSSVLFIVGDGPLEKEIKSLADNFNLSQKVCFLGLRADIPSLMSACDVFVLSSAWEGFGLVVAEAMACERLVVATNSGGVKEVLGDSGYLVPPRQPSALSEAMLKASTLNPNDRGELGRRARLRVVEFYSSEALSEKWIEIYQRVIN
ncbi:glycosyltransferase [Billgrantia lactosivorans]|uniref:glycosyltransferase n=1 Tax=Billgrantia lactosivorans TaxID=2185141 RepID=UPI000DAC5169|nr:glycosyltransferase [Halomonas lactosivorans]